MLFSWLSVDFPCNSTQLTIIKFSLAVSVPSIPRVQALIEEAWGQGADPQGASNFNHRLQGTRAWIGATEIYAVLTSLSVKYILKPEFTFKHYCSKVWGQKDM